MKMEFAWNTKKNHMPAIKGLQMEQDREGKITNKEIDPTKTHLNYDLTDKEMGSSSNLYHRVKNRVEAVRSVSRVQKNSVVDYSNVFTVSKEQAEIWGIDKTKDYFKGVYDYFCNEFGKENVVSAKVHLDETSPHMHLHFVPVNLDNGKLQSAIVMTPGRINKIHTEAPKYLQSKGFDVERGSGKTEESLEIKKYKLKMLEEDIKKLEEDIKIKNDKVKILTKVEKEIEEVEKIDYKNNKFSSKVSIEEKDFNNLKANLVNTKNENLELKSENIRTKDILKMTELSHEYLENENKELKIKVNNNDFMIRSLDHNYNLLVNSLGDNKKINDYVMNNILKEIYKENKCLELKIKDKYKLEDRLVKKVDDLKIKINSEELKDKNIFNKDIYSIKEIENKFMQNCLTANEKFEINVLLENQKKILACDIKMNFENKSLKNQLLNDKKINQVLKKEFKIEFDIQDKILNKDNNIKNTPKNTSKNSMDFGL